MGFYFKHLMVDIACVLAIKVSLLTLLPVAVLNGAFYPVYVKEVIQIVGCYGKGTGRRIVYMINRMRNRFGGYAGQVVLCIFTNCVYGVKQWEGRCQYAC